MVNDCDTCKHNDKNWDELPCDGCCTAHSGYEAGMNREEAKEILIEIKNNTVNHKIEVAIDMALKALEQEPCDDAISRQAVLYRIRESIETYHNQYTTDMLNMWGLFTQFIKEMSPVKPQESSITWVTGADGAKIAFKDVPVWKAIKICEILVEPQERSDKK